MCGLCAAWDVCAVWCMMWGVVWCNVLHGVVMFVMCDV